MTTTVGLLAAGPRALAQAPTDATSARAARREALQAIPWNGLARSHRADVHQVIKNTSMYRRLPTRVIDCDPELFTFLLQHPDIVVDVWKLMGISRVSLEREADNTFCGTDGAGTEGRVRYVYSDWGPGARNLAVVYGEGAYDGRPFVAPLKAQSVLLIRSGSVREANGRHHITVRIDSFVHFEQVGVELVAKTVEPWISKIADQNFIETVGFVSTFSRTAERNPHGMERLAARLPSIDEPTRRELVRLCHQTAEKHAARGTMPAAIESLLVVRRDSLASEASR